MSRIEWLNSLCPRFQHILQVGFSKEFKYDFEMARQAVQNSNLMLSMSCVDHIHPIYSPSIAEVVAFSRLRGDDESALRKTQQLFFDEPGHAELLRRYGAIGIGFAYSDELDVLFTSVRLR